MAKIENLLLKTKPSGDKILPLNMLVFSKMRVEAQTGAGMSTAGSTGKKRKIYQ